MIATLCFRLVISSTALMATLKPKSQAPKPKSQGPRRNNGAVLQRIVANNSRHNFHQFGGFLHEPFLRTREQIHRQQQPEPDLRLLQFTEDDAFLGPEIPIA